MVVSPSWRWHALGLVACLTIIGPVPPAVADKRAVLVIGNSAYRSVAPLRSPRNDARLIADTPGARAGE
jgi:hypothetical protein